MGGSYTNVRMVLYAAEKVANKIIFLKPKAMGSGYATQNRPGEDNARISLRAGLASVTCLASCGSAW